MFNWGRATGKVPRELPNPAVGIVRFAQRKRRRFVTTVEMPRLLAAIEPKTTTTRATCSGCFSSPGFA